MDLSTLPLRMKKLPRDDRFHGAPIPWFVAWENGIPEFRALSREKYRQAIKLRLCWVCGEPLGKWLGFVTGPMCVITRTTSEPPCHVDCATWSAQNCPFLSNPQMVRRQEDVPEGFVENVSGLGLTRNPGVAAVFVTRSFEQFTAQIGGKGPLITMGEPDHVDWWREGRHATRAEVQESIDSGLPALLETARLEGKFAIEALGKTLERGQRWLPADAAVAASHA